MHDNVLLQTQGTSYNVSNYRLYLSAKLKQPSESYKEQNYYFFAVAFFAKNDNLTLII